MVTVMIATQRIKDNELLAASIIGGFEHPMCVIASADVYESDQIIRSQKYDIDIFIIQVKMEKIGGNKLAGVVRSCKKYKDTPILFITSVNHNMVGFSDITTYYGYKDKNYISTPMDRLDIQGKLGLYIDRIIEDKSNPGKYEHVIHFEHSNGEVFVNTKDIMFAEVQNKTVTLYTKDGMYVLRRTTLDSLCKQIGSESIMKCHKSFALNIEAVKEIINAERRNWTAIFKNEMKCPISQTYYRKIKSAYISNMTR